MLELLLQAHLAVKFAHLAVDAHAAKALATQVLEELGVLALATENHGCQHQRAPSLALGQDLVGNLVGGLALNHATALGTVRHAHARKEKAQVVVDLGDGAHRRARVSRRGLLIDGDGGREAVDGVEVWLVHLAQELASVAGQALDVAALALGIDGVEGKARLTRAGEARDHRELVARDAHVDVLQVVLAGAAYDYGVGCHVRWLPSLLLANL